MGEPVNSIDAAQRVGFLGTPEGWREVCRLYRCRMSAHDCEQMAKLRTYIEEGLLVVVRPERVAGVSVRQVPTESELLEVARDEVAIYDEGATILNRDEVVRVLRAVIRHFAAGVAVARGETDASEGTPQVAPRNTIPDEVQRALDRMCTPLHESVLKGATAEADAHSMRIIREHIERTAWSTVERDGPPPVDGHTVFIGINSAGYACCFNAIWQGRCVMETAEGSYQQMSDLRQWRRLDRPLTP